jgi:sugar phosphate isomerase/epimerase
MRLGGPVFVKTDDPDELARAHRALGYRAAYTPAGLKAGDSDRIKAVREAFAAHDVVIAETGVWNNLMDPDEEARRANLTAVTEGLALADEVGALCCVDIAGGFNAEFWAGPHRDNFSQAAFDLAVENARKIIDGVKPKTAKFTYEMMPHMIPDSADRYLALIEAIDRPAFGVHLDAVNAINSPYRYYDTTAAIQECFQKLGQHVVSCHLKDIAMENDVTVRLGEVLAGRGGFDLQSYLQGIAGLPQDPPVMLEHLDSAEEYDQARGHVLSVGQGAGISFES